VNVEEIVLRKLREIGKPEYVKMPNWAIKEKRLAPNCIIAFEVYGSSDSLLSEKQTMQALHSLERKRLVEMVRKRSTFWFCLNEKVNDGQTKLELKKRKKARASENERDGY